MNIPIRQEGYANPADHDVHDYIERARSLFEEARVEPDPEMRDILTKLGRAFIDTARSIEDKAE
jgi:hypothetical protein